MISNGGLWIPHPRLVDLFYSEDIDHLLFSTTVQIQVLSLTCLHRKFLPNPFQLPCPTSGRLPPEFRLVRFGNLTL